MNTRMIGILIRKDLHLLRVPVLSYLLCGVLAIGLMGVSGESGFYAGTVVLITALMGLSFHPVMASTISEHKDQTLAFVLSMPIGPTEYTLAKLLANLLMFFVPWILLLAGALMLITALPAKPDGLIPLTTILFGVIAANAMAILFVAVVSESMQFTIGAQIASSLIFQSVLYGASHTAGIAANMYGATAVWNETVMLYLGIEIALSVCLLGAALWFQSRKTDFI